MVLFIPPQLKHPHYSHRIASVPIKSKRLGTTTTTSSAISPAKLRAAPVADARNKIIARNRSKITDAREKLAQITKQSGDVRQKLLRKQQQRQQIGGGVVGRSGKIPPAGLTSASAARHSLGAAAAATFPPKRGVAGRASHAAAAQRAARHSVAVDDMDMDDVEMDFVPAEYALRRTVHNDIAYSKMPPLPQFPRARAAPVPAAVPQPAYRQPQPLLHPLQPPSYHGHPQSHHRVVRRSPPVVMHQTHSWLSSQQPDPFDCYEVPSQRPSDVSEPKHLQRSVRGGHPDLIPTKGILRYGGRPASPPPPPHLMRQHQQQQQQQYHQQQQPQYHRGGYADDHQLSYEMRTRLERTPDAGASAGTFSNPYTVHNNHKQSAAAASPKPLSSSSSSSEAGGYRIVVSNLHSSVSQSDIRELFEDIGELVDARLVRPGVAEVIFRTLKDSELAVDTYHNRQLDGQPMKCLLVQPRPTAGRPTAPALKAGVRSSAQHVASREHSSSQRGNNKTPLEIDIDALHKVLFQPKSYARN